MNMQFYFLLNLEPLVSFKHDCPDFCHLQYELVITPLTMQVTLLPLTIVPPATGDFLRYMSNDIAIIPDIYGKVIMNSKTPWNLTLDVALYRNSLFFRLVNFRQKNIHVK